MNAAALARTGQARRQRELITPEGLSLPLTIASRGARAGALLIDLGVIFFGLVALSLVLLVIGINVFDEGADTANPAVELIVILLILLVFFSRYGYFLFFELGPRGATPGKRALGIRVAAHGTQRLTAEAIIARNLMRDVEVFIPAIFLLSGIGSSTGVVGVAAGIWLAVFVLFPCFNRDALRAGDLVAGTWVVEAERRKLMQALSVTEDRSQTYRFGEAELAVYGEHELQVLEGVLRHGNPEAQRQVMEAICRKIGWEPGAGDEREFLETFYAALRARLERDMRFGRRKKDKFS
jgi:uncharacterized RDD family membrane protein YckC